MLNRYGKSPQNASMYDDLGNLINVAGEIVKLKDQLLLLNGKTGGTSIKTSNRKVFAAANTAERMPDFACREVTVIALDGNLGAIYIGHTASVTSNYFGVKLKADGSITLPISNLNQLYITAATAGDGVSYVAL